jgi:DNA-binding transcriptional LysR family regulator
MHARVLRYLDEVVRRGSIRRAAEHLHVAPTAINRQILELEAELGRRCSIASTAACT